jgi:hypothetical protein
MDFKHKHSFEHDFRGVRMQHQGIKRTRSQGKVLCSKESKILSTMQQAAIKTVAIGLLKFL